MWYLYFSSTQCGVCNLQLVMCIDGLIRAPNPHWAGAESSESQNRGYGCMARRGCRASTWSGSLAFAFLACLTILGLLVLVLSRQEAGRATAATALLLLVGVLFAVSSSALVMVLAFTPGMQRQLLETLGIGVVANILGLLLWRSFRQ